MASDREVVRQVRAVALILGTDLYNEIHHYADVRNVLWPVVELDAIDTELIHDEIYPDDLSYEWTI